MPFCFLNLSAQENEKKGYELLVLEIEMFSSYQILSDDTKKLIDLAADYEKKGEYDLAIVFLEEALNGIIYFKQDEKVNDNLSGYKFLGSIISGIDYNRQEFELGFEQSDSVLLDELSKPFVGFEMKYVAADQRFNIENAFRYDSENLRNELFFKNKISDADQSFESRYGAMIDRNFKYNDLGYFEVFAEVNLKSTYNNSDWYWHLKNYSRFKRFKKSSVTIPDFFRNSLAAYLVKNFDFYNNVQFDYTMDFNESLKFANNDFFEHNGGISYQDIYFNDLKIKAASRYRYFNFHYQVSDSAFENTSNTVSFSPKITYNFNSQISLDVDYKIDIKKFRVKTEQEPDYTHNYINPSLAFRTGELSSISFGYVYEKKMHKLQDQLVEQYIKDQDYNSSGFGVGFDYTSLNGMLVSLSVEYSKRRYPNFSSETDFSIYSNRNILNILLYAQIPLFKNITLNIIGSYDNDKDIDSDFNDTISSFYTIELSYTF